MRVTIKIVYILFLISIIIFFATLYKNVQIVTSIAFVDSHRSSCTFMKAPLVYIKMIKCSSSTIANIMERYGDKYKLQMMTPVMKRLYIGWPYKPERRHVVQKNHYDISCRHVLYHPAFFHDMMGPGVFFFSSLRQPWRQFKSMVNYYNLLNLSAVPSLSSQTHRFRSYVINISSFDHFYRHSTSPLKYCIPPLFSLSRNPLSFNLAFPFLSAFQPFLTKDAIEGLTEGHAGREGVRKRVAEEWSEEKTKNGDNPISIELEKVILTPLVEKWITKVQKEVAVAVIERLDEWLVAVMRRERCWKSQDLLYRPANVARYEYKALQDEGLEKIHKEWSWVDYMLYERFNRTFHEKLKQVDDDDFREEVAHFKELLKVVKSFCDSHPTINPSPHSSPNTTTHPSPHPLHLPASRWHGNFSVDWSFCRDDWGVGESEGGAVDGIQSFC